MRTHFKDCDIYNPVCQFEVATTTFTKNARNWWDAHTLKAPDLLVTYEQLLEWIRHELVPDSNPALAYMEWSTLRYKGNVEEYMKHVERLMEYFPIQRDTMIACLARPISPEFVAELRNMDIRLEGMSDPKIKEVIRNHLIATRGHQPHRYPHVDRGHQRHDPDRRLPPPAPARHDLCLHATPKEPSRSSPPPNTNPREPAVYTRPHPKAPSDPAHTYLVAKYGEGPTPCYVCGKSDHGWVQCQKKKKGKCGVCGSEAHWTRHCRQRYRPSPQARLNFQTLCVEALSNPEVNLMNTPFDDDTSEVEEATREDSEEEGGQPSGDHSNDVTPQPTMCHAAVTSWKPVEEGLTPPNARMRSAVTLLDGEIMERWSQFLKKVCVDSSASVFPVSPPGQKGQLLYPIQVDSIPVVALLDHGASHCFMAREWAIEKQLPMEPLARPGTFTFFNGTHDSITYLVRCSSVQIGSHRRPWTFLVVSATPMPVVLGLDAIRGWPLFYSPLDDHLFILEWTSHRHEAWQPATSLHAGKIATNRGVNNSALPSHPALECSSLFPQHLSDPPCSPLPPTTSSLGHEDSFPPPVAKGTKDRPPSRSLIQVDPPLHSPPTDSCTGNVAVVAENVIDFLNVARSPSKVEWFGEAEDEGAVRLMTVTASGDEEAKQLQDFLTSLDPRLKAVVDRYPHLFAPPDPLPPERSVKHSHSPPHRRGPGICPCLPTWTDQMHGNEDTNAGAYRQGLGCPLGIALGIANPACTQRRGKEATHVYRLQESECAH